MEEYMKLALADIKEEAEWTMNRLNKYKHTMPGIQKRLLDTGHFFCHGPARAPVLR